MTHENVHAGDKQQVKALDRQQEGHESQHNSFMEELRNVQSIRAYEPKSEQKNGLASQEFMGIEKWVADAKRCGSVDQDQLAAKLANFADKTDKMWQKLENDPKTFAKASQDQWLTYGRFNKVFDLLDDKHRDKILETLPWSLRAGE